MKVFRMEVGQEPPFDLMKAAWMTQSFDETLTNNGSTVDADAVELAKWAVDNKLITPEGLNLVVMLTNAGWKSLVQIKADFVEADIPDEVPKRFRNRLMRAVEALKSPDQPVTKKYRSPTTRTVRVIVHNTYLYDYDYTTRLDRLRRAEVLRLLFYGSRLSGSDIEDMLG